MLSVNEVGIFMIYMENVLEHTEYKAGDGQDFAKGTKAKLAGDGNE